jgi:hypothetical protein
VAEPSSKREQLSKEQIALVDSLFSTPSGAHPDHGPAGPIVDYYVSPPPTNTKLVPEANDAWDILMAGEASVYETTGVDISTWLSALHEAFDQRTTSAHHAGLLFAMGLNANVPWIVDLAHTRDAPFSRCNREFAVRIFDTITRDSARSSTGACILSKRAFVDWYNYDVLPGFAKAQGFHFVATHEEDGCYDIQDYDDDQPSTYTAPRGFLTGVFNNVHRALRSAMSEDVSQKHSSEEGDLLITVPAVYESDLESTDRQVSSDVDEDEETTIHSQWQWDLGV